MLSNLGKRHQRRSFLKQAATGVMACGGATMLGQPLFGQTPDAQSADLKLAASQYGTFDVVVAGGGPAGIGAALATARNGARVLLLEGTNCLGGMLTNGLVPMIRTAGDGGGIVQDFWNSLQAVDACELTKNHAWINSQAAKMVAISMAREAGVKVLLHTIAQGVELDGDGLVGEVICQERAFKVWRFIRKHVPGFEKSAIIDVASYLGVRETRRIRGEAQLVEADVLEARKHADGICRASFYMDLHDGQKKTPEYKAALAPPPGEFYEIPYGCLVPQRVDHLLVAGRCISSSRPANGSLRLQATCMNLGQAAGTAAARCAQSGEPPRALNGRELRKTLAEQGMQIDT